MLLHKQPTLKQTDCAGSTLSLQHQMLLHASCCIARFSEAGPSSRIRTCTSTSIVLRGKESIAAPHFSCFFQKNPFLIFLSSPLLFFHLVSLSCSLTFFFVPFPSGLSLRVVTNFSILDKYEFIMRFCGTMEVLSFWIVITEKEGVRATHLHRHTGEQTPGQIMSSPYVCVCRSCFSSGPFFVSNIQNSFYQLLSFRFALVLF